MKFSNLFYHSKFFLLALSATLLFTSCSNPADSGDNGHEEDHHHAVGIVLKMNGTEIVRYENQQLKGQIKIAAGEETALITLYFLDEHGDEFQPDEPEHSLGWRNVNTSIAEIEQHEDDGKWSFHVHGITSDTTSVIFELRHGEHADFETAAIPVIVN